MTRSTPALCVYCGMEVRPTGHDRRFMDTAGKLNCPNGTFAHWDGLGGPEPVEDPYPEHAKMNTVVAETQAAGEFVEWLTTQRIHLMFWREYVHKGGVEWMTPAKPLLGLLAEWKGIDLDKIEQEKRAMLDAIRAANDGR